MANNQLRHFNLDILIDNINQTHSILQQYATKIVNRNLTFRNWLIGCYIVEYELNGEDRAQYGEKLMSVIAKRLTHIKGLTISQLYSCRTFYLTYPDFLQTVSVELKSIGDDQNVILQTVSVKSLPLSEMVETAQSRRPTKELDKDLILDPALLLSRLTYSHFLELIRVEDPLKRLFYEVEAIKNSWSVRTLERAINTLLCERTGLSTNKKAVIAKLKNIKPESNADIIRNPLVLEFLGLEEKSEYSESELEQSIITHLQKFLMELGTGFCFEARQRRITFDNTHYYIDLVFYHRILKCHVLIDLKIGAFTHADAGQMTLYLNYYKAEEMAQGDNPPIGIILCADKKDTLVKYATANMEDQLFVSKYMVDLPEKKMLENFIKKELEG